MRSVAASTNFIMKKLLFTLLALANLAIAQTLTGEASYYSVSSNGGTRTASGIPLSDVKLSAASNAYPLGSVVRVTNLANNKSVEVKITDRGPFATKNGKTIKPLRPHPTRIIDLSRAAASSIYNLRTGKIKVKVIKIK